MILLTSTDSLRFITSGTANVDTFASFADKDGTTVTPGNGKATVSSATTTTLVAAPASGVFRTIRYLSFRNRHASAANTITVLFTSGGTDYELKKLVLAAGEEVVYDEAAGWIFFNANGMPKVAQSIGALSPAVNTLNLVVLASDVTNNNGSANTLQDITGLSFAVNSGETYWFRATIDYTAAATTTGSRWTINGPAMSRVVYAQTSTLTATTQQIGYQTALQMPAASSASSLTAGNIAVVEGSLTPSVSGTVQMQFASEISASAIVAKAGSTLQWVRTL